MKYTVYMPRRATINSAGYDFLAPEDLEFKAKTWTVVDLGVCFEDKDTVVGGQPERAVNDWVMLLFPRSSLGMEYGFRFKNTVGVIDSDFRGSIKIEVWVDKALSLSKGKKVCQGVLIPILKFEGEIKPDSVRGEGGFGSTDKEPEVKPVAEPMAEVEPLPEVLKEIVENDE